MPSSAPLDLRRRHRVETPELVALNYELAGLGSRALAMLLDATILGAGWLVLLALTLWLGEPGLLSVGAVLFYLYGLFALVGYPALGEWLFSGRTIGKRVLGLRVVDTSGRAASPGQIWLRNVVRLADMLPPPYLLGLAFVGLHPRHQRLGDLVAGTLVVRDRPREADARAAALATPAVETSAPQLDDALFGVLERFAEREAELAPEPRARIAAQLAIRLGEAAGPGTPEALLALHAREAAARAAGFRSSRSAGTAAAPWVARRNAAWGEFERETRELADRGLDALDGAALVGYAARYRAVSADLARARTYGAGSAITDRLERLVGAAHAQLYRADTRQTPRIGDLVLRAWPAAVVRQRATIGLATLAFLLPGLAGWGVVRATPAIAEEIVDATMRERAAAAEARRARGEKYVTFDATERPTVAIAIIGNNVRVALLCFAGGVFAGVGALVLLGLNGLQLGAAAGHYANVGQLGYLGEFIVGHGPLELFAIWVAGAGGFLLGRALVAPGRWTRGAALRLAGREAGMLVGSSALMLVLAGLIEGLLSASGADWALRLGAAAGSVLLLGLWLLGGRGVTPPAASPASGSRAVPAP